MAQIVLDDVDKMYPGGVKAVDGLSLVIADGEFMVLVGPSGCGKSTALRSIAGLEEISSGTISIGDRVVNDLAPKDRDIAMVFQNYALYPHMTVEQNLAFGLRQRKTPKMEIDRRVNDAARILGLGQFLSRKPAALSGGQRQRVAMGRYVTHDQVEAMTLGHRVCVLRDGRLQQVDTPQALFDSPVNLFVAGFIGSPAMNFVTATLIRDAGLWATFAGHRLPVPAAAGESWSGLADYLGRDVIMGVRPSDFEHGSIANPQWPRMQVTASATEALGSEIHVIFTIDAPPVGHPSLTGALSEDAAGESIPLAGGSQWTGRVAARSQVRAGQRVELGVDTANLRFFDPASGLALSRGSR